MDLSTPGKRFIAAMDAWRRLKAVFKPRPMPKNTTGTITIRIPNRFKVKD